MSVFSPTIIPQSLLRCLVTASICIVTNFLFSSLSFVSQVKSSRGYWSKLPQTVCAHEKLAPLAGSADGDCWNGNERARYAQFFLSFYRPWSFARLIKAGIPLVFHAELVSFLFLCADIPLL